MKNKKSYKRVSEGQTTRSGARTSLMCLGIGACLVVFCSCLSFDIGDWPSRFVYPHNSPPANWCGTAGAFCAYYLLYYIGPGVFVILVSGICFLVARLAHKPTSQPILRTIGLGLMTVAASMTFQCLWPYRFFGFPMGSGGVLGIGAAQFLRSHFASLGTFILVVAIWVVGILLSADNFILRFLGWLDFGAKRAFGAVVPAWSVTKRSAIVGQGLNDIWQKLSVRQSVKGGLGNKTPRLSDVGTVKPLENIPVKHSPIQEVSRPSIPESKRSVVQPSYEDYELPPVELLAEPEYSFAAVQEKVIKAKAMALERLLSEFNINARVVAAETGPVITMFELELAAGVKVSQIAALANDMARALGAGAVRVVAPLPGKHTIGIEVPNNEKEKVRMKNMMDLAGSRPQSMEIPLFLGKDSAGEALVSDLTTMPHLLIAGTTGSGKSVCINTIITGILLTKRPDEVKLILIDPKMVEMTAFNIIPHLMCPIVTETQTAVQILEWATVKMDERYALLAEARVKNVAEYNRLGSEEIIKRFNPSSPEEETKIPKKLPYIVIVIDE
ncbi:MAG: DNA translocase FtsK 4TM domain-containing protein, partial [Phycisphaerae bacterium]